MLWTRRLVLDWAARGRIAAPDLVRALVVAEALPSPVAWRRFIDALLLWVGVLLVASGVIFFLAFNWTALDRLAKLALAEALVVGALAVVWRSGLEQMSGKAALLGAALFVGALLALIGQIYQTGADSVELFGAWALLILPWALVGRFSALWLLWLLVANVAVATYFEPRRTDPFEAEPTLWVMAGLNTAALAVWETAARHGVEWLRPRWAPRLVAAAAGATVTALLVEHIWVGQGSPAWPALAWTAWLAVTVAVYRRTVKDVFVLTGVVLSVIVVVTSFLGNELVRPGFSYLSLLLIAGTVIALAAGGAAWVKRVAEPGA